MNRLVAPASGFRARMPVFVVLLEEVQADGIGCGVERSI
jgi:hypothetical protein